jgi:hypothetical protein
MTKGAFVCHHFAVDPQGDDTSQCLPLSSSMLRALEREVSAVRTLNMPLNIQAPGRFGGHISSRICRDVLGS